MLRSFLYTELEVKYQLDGQVKDPRLFFHATDKQGLSEQLTLGEGRVRCRTHKTYVSVSHAWVTWKLYYLDSLSTFLFFSFLPSFSLVFFRLIIFLLILLLLYLFFLIFIVFHRCYYSMQSTMVSNITACILPHLLIFTIVYGLPDLSNGIEYNLLYLQYIYIFK